MKVMGIDCSQKRRDSTGRHLLQVALEKIESYAITTDAIRLIDYTLELCTGCNQCVTGGMCPIDDDFDSICERAIPADALLFVSPVYWGRYPSILSCFIDRMRKITTMPHPLYRKKAGLIVQTGITDTALTVGSFGQLFRSFNMINVVAVGLGMMDYEGRPLEDKNAIALVQLVGERLVMGLQSEKIKEIFG
ncbi:MAG: flavodoxin family protein [Theionarchaea archaeon]|nr:flavodoxin family protein [Theionarchaea archaeon]MBU7036389.1 flavodoxin family protein [Theionarchaea archaeon]